MKTMKKLMAVLIVLAMTIALIPAFPVFAAGETESDKVVLVGKGQTYTTFKALFDTANNGKTVDELNGYTIKMVSDISEPNSNIYLRSTKSFSLTIDGDGHTLTMINPFVVSSLKNTSEAIVSGVTASVVMKNIIAVKDTVNDHPLVYVRAGAKVVVENCSVSDGFNYAFGLSKFDGELTVKSGTYYSKKAVFRSNYQSDAQTSLIVEGGYYELVDNDANEGLIDPVKAGENSSETKLKVTINGGTFKTNGAVMFPCLGTTDIVVNGGSFVSGGASMFACKGTTSVEINDGAFVVNGNVNGELIFDVPPTGTCDIDVNGGIFVAKNALFAYLYGKTGSSFSVTNGIFWQNVRFPVIFERAKMTNVSVTGGIFYSPDYRLYDGGTGEIDDLPGSTQNNPNTMTTVDGINAPASTSWSCSIQNAKFYYTVSQDEDVAAVNAAAETFAIPSTETTASVRGLTHNSMCGKIKITPETVDADATFADLYVTDGVTIPVVLDGNLNNAAFEGAYITMNKNYTGAALELTQALTINKNGFTAEGITAGGAASVRQDLDGAKVYVQYSDKGADGSVTARLVVGIESLDYKHVGIKVTANSAVADASLGAYAAEADKVATFNISSCYGSLVADGKTVSAYEYGGKYFIAIEITGIKQDTQIRFNAYATLGGKTTETGIQSITLRYPA